MLLVDRVRGTDGSDRPQEGPRAWHIDTTRKQIPVTRWSIRSGSRAIWLLDFTDWFEGLTITLEANGETLLTGPVVDQAALHGLLKKVRDLGLPVVSVVCVQPGVTAR